MVEVNALLLLMIIFFSMMVPRFTLVLFALFANEAMIRVFDGTDMVAALIVGWLIFPRLTVTHFLFASIKGAPETGSGIYVAIMILAFLMDVGWWSSRGE